LRDFVQSVRYSFRVLFSKPGFTFIAVSTLALGIGANTSIFSLLDQVLLRRLPVSKPEELVILRSPGPMRGSVSSDSDSATSFSVPMYKALRDRNTVLSGLLARFAIALSVSSNGQTERADGELVSGNYFEVLGVQPALGRMFSLEDDKVPGAHPVAVLSHKYWMNRFAGNPSILNQTLLINGHQLTVVGIARAGFDGIQVGQNPDVFIPMMMTREMVPGRDGLDDWNTYWLALMGRLKPGLTAEQAQAGILPTYQAALQEQLPNVRNPSEDWKQRFLAKPLQLLPGSGGRQVMQREIKTALLALFGMVVGVLLIACTNVANLQLVRGLGRRREMAIRLSLGASRWSLARQLLLESLVLAMLGGFVGLLLAWWVSDLLVSAMSSGSGAEGLSSQVNGRMMLFTLLASLASGVICGLLPLRSVTSGDMTSALKDQSATTSTSKSQTRLRRVLVVSQVALTMLLLVGAGLMTRTLWNLRGVDLGLRTDKMITFEISPELNAYKPDRTVTLCRELTEKIAALPGVVSTSIALVPPLTDNTVQSNVTFEGMDQQAGSNSHIMQNWVSPGFFAAMGVPLIAGRDFTLADQMNSQKVGIINETAARQYLAGRNPIGTRFAFGSGNTVKLEMEVIGVVKDTKHVSVREAVSPFVYMPYAQFKDLGSMTFYVRTTQEPGSLGPQLRRTVASLDPNLPVANLKTMDDVIGESLFGERMMAFLSISFGLLAALLAALGLYGVLAYWVVQRTQEIGIRVALGASSANIRALVMWQGMRLTIVGVAIGLAGALALSQLLRSMLFGIGAMDPLTFVAVGSLLLLVALLACYIPARRATRVDPLIALRYQ
jgi:putative ABC transport system permease protein